MNLREHVSLAPLTTLGVGGEARFFIEAQSEDDITEAIVFAREQELPLFVIGEGSNVLVSDAGVPGLVVRAAFGDTVFEEDKEGTLCIAGAGARWDDIVDRVGARGLFGIENLAGIPGSLGGAVVQNIGAYGAELSDVFAYADCTHRTTGIKQRITHAEAELGYRTSFFKQQPAHIITRVALRFTNTAQPRITYPDLVRASTESSPLTTPAEIASAVRTIRSFKFPQSAHEGSAGSFFKNPIVTSELASSLMKRFPGLPTFPQKEGTVKISLAWLLDHVLALKGFTKGPVRLFEKQPLVIVATAGARASEVDALAKEVEMRVATATGITIEREVETFGVK